MRAAGQVCRLVGGLFAAVLGLSASGWAVVVGGGGSPTTDCLAVYDAPFNAAPKPNVTCVDGDVTCDADGVVNGICEIPVTVCVNSTAIAACTLDGVETITVQHAMDNGDPKFDPDFQALQTKLNNDIQPPTTTANLCTNAPSNVHIFIKGPVGKNKCQHNSKKLAVTTTSTAIGGKVFTDKDTLKFSCEPAADTVGGCDPQTLFGGTFDRIQKEIFNESCAVSGCHDSQSHQNNLILEVGASYTNLINVAPTNGAALEAGWLRVTPGDSSKSYLYHKVTGDLPDPSYGVRMPHKQPANAVPPKPGRKLNSTLIDIIQLWIDAGAPETGWVAGTF